MTREEAARAVERDMIKHAGVIRNLVIEGLDPLQAASDPRAQFWIAAMTRSWERFTNE